MRDKIIARRYLAPGETCMDDVYQRVANCIVPSEYSTKAYTLMSEGKFLPNSPTLSNAGVPGRVGTLSACFVLPIEDNLDSIMGTATDMALVHKAFGGTGFNFSNIRSKNETITSTGGTACGPIRVIELYNQVAETLAQGGKRSGANMAILNADHPDIEEFIARKQTENLDHFNFSVGVFDDTPDDILVQCAEGAHKCGCPGLIFLDEINRRNPCPSLGRIEATNPCGESPLLPYESCNLGSINLSKFVNRGEFDIDGFTYAVRFGVLFLNNVIDKNQYPLPKIQEATLLTRKIGLGIMGWADALIKMDIPYASSEAIFMIDTIGKVLSREANYESSKLANMYGHSYPACEDNKIILNATRTCIAPTGTISYLANCSSGIEPNYEWEYTRTSDEGMESIRHPLYDQVMSSIHMNQTAQNITPYWHLAHQATWQKYIDLAVSKTINMPATATVEDIINVYKLARDKGVMGITVYRDGSKDKQVLNKIGSKNGHNTGTTTTSRSRLDRYGITYQRQSGCGLIYLTANDCDDKPWETFVRTAGGCEATNEAIGRLISGWLQDGGDPKRIARMLRKVRCVNAMRASKSDGKSCADIIGKCIETRWGARDGVSRESQTTTGIAVEDIDGVIGSGGLVKQDANRCPECGSPLKFGRGCKQGECSCGWAGCS